MLEKRRAIRDAEALRKRDAEMFRSYLDTRNIYDVAKVFRCTAGNVSQRFKKMPFQVKQRIKHDHAAIRNMRLETLRDEIEIANAS